MAEDIHVKITRRTHSQVVTRCWRMAFRGLFAHAFALAGMVFALDIACEEQGLHVLSSPRALIILPGVNTRVRLVRPDFSGRQIKLTEAKGLADVVANVGVEEESEAFVINNYDI